MEEQNEKNGHEKERCYLGSLKDTNFEKATSHTYCKVSKLNTKQTIRCITCSRICILRYGAPYASTCNLIFAPREHVHYLSPHPVRYIPLLVYP